jgi:hypothetical protein
MHRWSCVFCRRYEKVDERNVWHLFWTRQQWAMRDENTELRMMRSGQGEPRLIHILHQFRSE